MTIRIDAPAACGCNPRWVDSPSGPKAQCQCPGRVDTRGLSPVAAAHARANAEARKAAQAGPPAGARVRDQAVHNLADPHVDTRGLSPVDAAHARAEAHAARARRAGPPAGARVARPATAARP